MTTIEKLISLKSRTPKTEKCFKLLNVKEKMLNRRNKKS